MSTLINDNVKRIIQSKGYKQKSIAQRAGYSQKQFSDMMCGRRVIGGYDVLRIANALEVTPNDLFGMKN